MLLPESPLPPTQIIYDSITVELLPAIKVFSTSISSESSDPLSYLDVMSCEDAAQWRKAIEEIQSIIHNKTWELSDLLLNCQVIGTK